MQDDYVSNHDRLLLLGRRNIRRTADIPIPISCRPQKNLVRCRLTGWREEEEGQDGVINDPLGQTHNPGSSDYYFHLIIVLFYAILKSGDGQTDGRKYRHNVRRK